MNTTAVKIEEVLGHLVKASITVSGYFGDSLQVLEGRLMYSTYQGNFMFMPKGKRSRGYVVKEENIHSVEIIRKDKQKHEEYSNVYANRKLIEEEAYLQRQNQERLRVEENERIELEKKRKAAKLIDDAKSLGGYKELEEEVLAFYKSFTNEFFNESFIKSTCVPLLNNLIKKGIPNVNQYPKYYFDKKQNPKLCALVEKKLGLKLPSTQKGSVERLNTYLKG